MKLLLIQSKSIKNILWGKIFSVLSLGLILFDDNDFNSGNF